MNRFRLSAAALGVLVLLWGSGCGGQPGDADGYSKRTAQRLDASMSAAPRPASQPQASWEEPATNSLAPDGDISQLRQQVELLRREVADIRSQLARSPTAGQPVPAVPDPRVDPEARAQAERDELLRNATLESAFRHEDYDSRWSQDTSASVRASLAEADAALRSQVRSVECRSRSCRVEIDTDTQGSAAQALPLLAGRLAMALPNVTAAQVDQGNGVRSTVLYLAR